MNQRGQILWIVNMAHLLATCLRTCQGDGPTSKAAQPLIETPQSPV